MPFNIKIILAYDGVRFLGWQKTRTGLAIQEELENGLSRILGTSIQTEAASRTDRGVHAKGQVVHFRTELPIDPLKLRRSLQAVLSQEISIVSVQYAEENFHPTLDAHSKEYHYWICNSAVQLPTNRLYSWHIHQPLDIDAMRDAAQDFLGTHDFLALTNERTDDSIRTIHEIEILPKEKNRIVIQMHADRFLYKMARNIVGTLVDIGRQKLAKSSVPQILASKMRANAGMTAPAHGLFLMEVFYAHPIK